MNARRILLWGLPLLIGGVTLYFSMQERAFQREEQAFQEMRQKGWLSHLPVQGSGFGMCSSYGDIAGDITVDKQGRIWVAGGCSQDGIHVFDGTQWTTYTQQNSRLGWPFYSDLTIDSSGQVWAVVTSGKAVDVFDGTEWRTYTNQDLGMPDAKISTIEADEQGRLWTWVVYLESPAPRIELRVLQDNIWTTYFQKTSEYPIGPLTIDIDNQGRVWVATYDVSLSVFDGETWESVAGVGANLRYVVGAAFDKQGRVWVATLCGGVKVYDGDAWTTYVEDNSSPDCDVFDTWVVQDILIDKQGRVWTWSGEQINILHISSQTTLTPENSGLPANDIYAPDIYALAVDDRGRAWVGHRLGVSMVTGEGIQPVAEEIIDRRHAILGWRQSTNGFGWFLPSILSAVWLATYLNVLPGVLIALALGLLALVPFGPPIIRIGYAGSPFVNPGVVATYSGILGGLIGGQIDKGRAVPRLSRWAIGLAIAGAIVGFVITFLLVLIGTGLS